MSKKQLEEKHLKMLRQLLTLPDNKKCMDCKAKGPFYACTTFGTFVCPTCSGIHREFGHRVKSISMATFTPEEVKFLSEMGNGNAREIWLATWSSHDYPEPDAGETDRIKDFMHKKYIVKAWYRKPGGEDPPRKRQPREQRITTGRGVDVPPQAEPLETILGKDIPPIQITHNVNVNVSSVPQRKEKSPKVKTQELLWDDPVPAIPPHQPLAYGPAPVVPNPTPTPAPPPGSSSLSGLESIFTTPAQEVPKGQPSTPWAPPPHAVPPLAGPLPQITAEAFQQMNPLQQQHYLALQQQWLQQQQFLLQQRMGAVSLGPPSQGYPASSNPFVTQPSAVYAPPLVSTGPSTLPPSSISTPAVLSPTQPKEVKKDTSSLLFADLSPIGRPTAPTTPPTTSPNKLSPLDFGSFQSAPPPQPQSNSSAYNPFGF